MSTRFFKLPGRGRKPGTEAVPGALLTDRQHQLIEQELALLAQLLDIMGRYPAAQEDQSAVTRAAEHLTSLFLLVIVGEFNAGKSAFINALAGADVMPEGVTPTTSVINQLRYGPEPTVVRSPYREEPACVGS